MPRIPVQILKWAGVVASICSAALLVGSGWRHPPSGPGPPCELQVDVFSGGLSISRTGMGESLFGSPIYFGLFQPLPHWDWVPRYHVPSEAHLTRRVFIPLYIPLVIIALPTVLAFRSDRRWKGFDSSQCTMCGYDLAAIEGVCPECGRPRPVPSTAQPRQGSTVSTPPEPT